MQFSDKDGVITLDGDSFSLKIDSSRKIYVKNNNGSNNFESVPFEMPTGFSMEQKKAFLYDLYNKVEKKRLEKLEGANDEKKE